MREDAEGYDLSRLVQHEQERLDELHAAARQAVKAGDAVAALYLFEHFRKAFERHQRWEEESLFEEYERLATGEQLRRALCHHRHHQEILRLSTDVLELLARRLLVGHEVDAALEARLLAMESLLDAHGREELFEVCGTLDRELSDETVRMIAEELELATVPPPLAPTPP
jgi:hypothetical protein